MICMQQQLFPDKFEYHANTDSTMEKLSVVSQFVNLSLLLDGRSEPLTRLTCRLLEISLIGIPEEGVEFD